MTLVMYHPEQDAFRFYDCARLGWCDMLEWEKPVGVCLTTVIEYGWEVIGEL